MAELPAEFSGTLRDYYNRRLSAMKLERSSFESHWSELSEYIEPRRGRFFITDRNKGDKRHGSIINSRGTQALRTSTAGMFAGVMSPARPWFKLETLKKELMQSTAVKQWLWDVEKVLRAVFLESNLYNMAPVTLGETMLFGTGAMSQLDDFEDVARFYNHTAGSYMIGQNERGVVDTFVLEKELTVGQIVRKFGIENVSIAVKDCYNRGSYDKWFPVVQFVEPNPDFKSDSVITKDNMPFRSVWYESGSHGTAADKNKFLRKSGFEEFPVHIPRWSLTGEDIYGTSCPGMVVLGDVKALQIMEKRKAQAIDKLVNPPLKGPPSIRDVPIVSLPGGVNIYDQDGQHDGLTTLYQVEPRLQEMRAEIDAVESRINEGFFVDLFLAISAMQGIQPRNQLELTQRNEERLLMLGPPLERLQNEFLSNIVERTFRQVQRAGILPEPPEELDGSPINVRFISALAQAQRAVEVGTIERATLFAAQLAQLKRETLDKFDADMAFDKYIQLTGADPDIVTDDESVNDIREQRAQVQQAQLEAEVQAKQATAAQGQANAANTVANTVKGE